MIKLLAVERVKNLNAQEFLKNYKRVNKPVVIEQLTQNWPARKKWSIDYFKQVAGDKMVPFSFSSLFDVDFDNPDYEKYPALKQLQGEVVELNHGDMLYIPPGYWHYIEHHAFA